MTHQDWRPSREANRALIARLEEMGTYCPSPKDRETAKLAAEALRVEPIAPPSQGEVRGLIDAANISETTKGHPQGEFRAATLSLTWWGADGKDKMRRFRDRIAALPSQASTAPGEGEETTLAECPIGLFWSGDTLALKSEYGNNEGRIDAYIVESGEFFWGAAPQTIASQRATRVRPLGYTTTLAALSQPEGPQTEVKVGDDVYVFVSDLPSPVASRGAEDSYSVVGALRRLVGVASNLAGELSDPGTEALAAIYCGERALASLQVGDGGDQEAGLVGSRAEARTAFPDTSPRPATDREVGE